MSKKIEIKREHFNFNIPVRIISEDEAKQRLLDELDKASQPEVSAPQVGSAIEAKEAPEQEATRDNSKSRKFTGMAYSGEAIPRHFIFENLFIDVDGMKFQDQIPIFMNHDPDKIIGFATPRKVNGQLMVDGVLDTEGKYGADIARLTDLGMDFEMSVGVEPEYIQEVTEGTFFVNGQDRQGPGFVFKNPRLLETSVVPIGADSNTSMQLFNKDITKQIEVRTMETITMKLNGQDVQVTKEENTFKVSFETPDLDLTKEYTFCPCMEAEELTEEEKKKFSDLTDENAELRKKIEELQSKDKKGKFAAEMTEKGIEISEEELANMTSEDMDKFSKAITGVKAKSPKANKELFKDDDTADKFSGLSDIDKITVKTHKFMAEHKETTGNEISFVEAQMKMVNLGL